MRLTVIVRIFEATLRLGREAISEPSPPPVPITGCHSGLSQSPNVFGCFPAVVRGGWIGLFDWQAGAGGLGWENLQASCLTRLRAEGCRRRDTDSSHRGYRV
jgi:hypothetical protein